MNWFWKLRSVHVENIEHSKDVSNLSNNKVLSDITMNGMIVVSIIESNSWPKDDSSNSRYNEEELEIWRDKATDSIISCSDIHDFNERKDSHHYGI